MQAAVLNHLVALVADAVLNHHHHDNNQIVDDHDLDPDRHVVVVAQQLRVFSAAYMALGASLLLVVPAGGDSDGDDDHDHILVGFLLWMAGAVLLHLSFTAGRFPTAAFVAAGAAQAALKELVVPTILALARHWNTADLGFQSLNL